jgi:diamine N-acetyltransferase
MPETPRWEIRTGCAEDANQLAEFARRTFCATYAAKNTAENLSDHLAESFGVEQQSAELVDSSVTTLLALAGKELHGYAQLRPGVAPGCPVSPSSFELHRFYVDASAHGRGLAQQLMAAAIDKVVSLGADQLWLGVWEQNPRAIAFYQKQDFSDAGYTEFKLGADSQRDRILVRELSQAPGGHEPD